MRYDMVSLYYFIDAFCKCYEDWERHWLLPSERQRFRTTRLSLSEMLLIVVMFPMSPCRVFKYYYTEYLGLKHRNDFPALVDYDRFLSRVCHAFFLPLQMMLHILGGEEQGIYFMDSTSIPVCRSKRINRNRVFAGMAARGKTTMGWCYGFKLHLVINHKGQMIAAKITRGNADDRKPVEQVTRNLKGFIALDKGYISKELFRSLYNRGLKIIAGIRKGMKNMLMTLAEKILLRKRFVLH